MPQELDVPHWARRVVNKYRFDAQLPAAFTDRMIYAQLVKLGEMESKEIVTHLRIAAAIFERPIYDRVAECFWLLDYDLPDTNLRDDWKRIPDDMKKRYLSKATQLLAIMSTEGLVVKVEQG